MNGAITVWSKPDVDCCSPSHPVPEELAGAARYVARDEASLLAYLESLSAGFQLCGMERTACDPDSREEGTVAKIRWLIQPGVRFSRGRA
ncbi:MAG: hypothetical protein ACLVHV_05480 [Oscillospiraceae bacterium]